MNRFIKDLRDEISHGLPGTDVQWEMASSDRMARNFPRIPRNDSASAAVLILLYPSNSRIYTIFIKRPDYGGVHGGQISFPGGKREPDDKDLTGTALREASEEISVNTDMIEIIGTLTPLFIPISNIVVTPVVAWTNKRPEFKPDADEVEFIIEAGLEVFLDRSIVKRRPWKTGNETIDIRYFDYDGNVIWGATAMILNELLVILNRAGLYPKV